MTNPGDSGERGWSEPSTPSSSGAYEAPPIEHSRDQGYESPSAGYEPGGQSAPVYPPPSFPPPDAPPLSYPGGSDTGYPPPPPYPGQPPYGGQPGYGAPPPGAYPPAGYPGGGYGYGAPPQGGTNNLAIGSLVASVVGVLCGIGSIVGIVLGIVAMNQIKERGQAGYGLAVTGIAVGVATLLINMIWTIYALS